MPKVKKVGTSKLRAKAKKTLGKRKGQSTGKGFPEGYYVKGGTLHKKSLKRDRAIKSKRTRKRGEPHWRGDLKGSRI